MVSMVDQKAIMRSKKPRCMRWLKDSVGLVDGPSLAGKCPVMSHAQTSTEVKRPVSN